MNLCIKWHNHNLSSFLQLMNINLNDKAILEYCLVWETSRGEPFLKACMSKFKCIKMLDLSYSNFDTLPIFISNLKHLRLLNLNWNERIKKLPNSICKLFHLQRLSLFKCAASHPLTDLRLENALN